MDEVWKDVPGYEGKYQVSDFGSVKSVARTVLNRSKKESFLSACMSGRKYYSVILFSNNKPKRFSVHQLVAMAFLDHIPNGNKLVVDHVNGIHTDNRLCNLQILSHSENLKKRNCKIKRVCSSVGRAVD